MDPKIFSGQSNEQLARAIVDCIPEIELKPMHFHHFPDGESKVRFEESIRGEEIFIIQSTNPPVENFFQLLMMIDAAKRASVERMYIVIPYMGFMRQDGKEKPREPITARLVSNLIDAAAENVPHHVISVDLHSKQQEGYFESITQLYARPVVVEYFRKRFSLQNLAVGAPDMNATKQARAFAERLGDCPLIIIDKRRPRESVSEVIHVIGEVKGKTVIFVDDMVDTFGTLDGAVNAVLEKGAREVYAFGTHGILSGPAIERIHHSRIKKVFITDTICHSPQALDQAGEGKIERISIAPLLAKALLCIHNKKSVSSLFE